MLTEDPPYNYLVYLKHVYGVREGVTGFKHRIFGHGTSPLWNIEEGTWRANPDMWRYALRRVAGMLPQLLLISLLAFLIMKAAPGSPIASLVGGREFMTDADFQRVAHNLGLDRPLLVQYGAWLGNLLQGDWGHSLKDGREISVILWDGLRATLVLAGVSWLVLLVLAVAAGYWAGTRAHTKIDYAVSGLALVSFATPAFWLGLILILVFSVTFDLLPSAGQSSLGRDNDLADYLSHLILPVTCIVLTHVGPYIRLVRGSVRDVLGTEFYKSARARGLSRAPRWYGVICCPMRSRRSSPGWV